MKRRTTHIIVYLGLIFLGVSCAENVTPEGEPSPPGAPTDASFQDTDLVDTSSISGDEDALSEERDGEDGIDGGRAQAGGTFDWRLIPAGSYFQGSPEDENERYDNEGPQREVTITRPFYLKATTVTQAEWVRVVGNNPSYRTECTNSTRV